MRAGAAVFRVRCPRGRSCGIFHAVTNSAEEPLPASGRDERPLAVATARVRRYLRFHGCEWSLADDLAQETMFAAVSASGTELPPLPWLLTTARNCLRMHLRRRGRRREIDDLDRLHEQWVAQARDDGGDAQRVALDECLRKLPEKARRVVELRYREGLSREAIASQLALQLEGVKSLLARTRMSLGECIRRRLGDG